MRTQLSVVVTSLLIIFFTTLQIIDANDKFCGTVDIPLNPVMAESREGGGYPSFGRLTFRLSAFYDISLLNKYGNNTKAVEEFIYRTVSSVSMSYRHSSIQRVADFGFQIKKIGFYRKRIPEKGIGNFYRGEFCAHIKRHNFRGFMSNTSSTQGLAHINVACDWWGRQGRGVDPCTLVEGRQYRAAMILTHELGHILGMNHDEAINCGDKDVMSQSTGDGKTRWSHCSVAQMATYLTYLKKTSHWCFEADASVATIPSQYKSTDVGEQCRTSLGPNFHEYYPWNKRANICRRIQCTDGIFIIPIHPAMENTPCAPERVCFEGLCRRF